MAQSSPPPAAPSPDLAHLIRTCGLPRTAHVLRIGIGSPTVEGKLRPIVGALDGAKFAVEGDAFNMPLPGDIGLAIVMLPPARMADVFEELIYDRLAGSLAPDGIAVIQFCRDASDEALAEMNVAPAARETLQAFNEHAFGARTIETVAPIAARFDADGVFECVGWAPRTRRAVTDEPVVWLVLRKRAHAGETRAIHRSPRADRYAIAELGDFFHALRDEGIDFVSAAAFAARHAAPPQAPFGLVKLDLHRHIRRPPEVARALSKAKVPGLFLMMHRHPFNEAYFDAPDTWNILNAVRDDGHEIGLHLDAVHLVRTFGDLYKGVDAAVSDFGARGFTLRASTLHGDTSPHITARGLKAWDFFAEDKARSTWDGKPPEGEEFLAEHVGRYSYAELAAKFGIDDLAEARFRHRGEALAPRAQVYLTDNRRTLQLMNIPNDDGTVRTMAEDAPFRITTDFARRIAPVLRTHPFLALFHPQWFW